jgi:integrase
MLLGLNGLRCGELIACDVTDVGSHSLHHTLALRTTKGDRPTVVALAPPTMQALDAAIGGRVAGAAALEPQRATHDPGTRAVPRRRGVTRRRDRQHLTPHGLRHSAITISLDAGVSLRDNRTSPATPTPRPPAGTTARATP